MAQKRQDINAPKKGMSEKHPSQLQSGEYGFMLNGGIENFDTEGIMLTNEPSNVLCSVFKEGYKVIGVQRDVTNDRTFFFLVNPDTNCSEIGYIPSINNITNLTDIEQNCNCDFKIQLATPLEDQEESEVCTYTTLINDCECSNDVEGNQCLNFNINYPISTEINEAKCGTVIIFTDDLNPRRRIEVDNIEQYFLDEEECEESDVDCDCGIVETEVCINCEKLLLQKPFKVPCIDVKGLVNGGNLKHGVYEFYVAYTDGNGNEMTRYMGVTGEVAVKDRNKPIYQQPELDAPTNYSIKLEINNLDEDYQFFKVAVKQITSVDAAVSYFDVGTFPITLSSIIYSGGEANLSRSSANQIMQDYPIYTKAKTVEAANNILFFTDLETIPEVNLQPVVNLMGQFARWRTSVAEENLYANPEGGAKYRSYLRDEQVPFAIRFFTKDGYVTANFPLISRAITPEDCYFDEFLSGEDYTGQQAEIDSLVADFTPEGDAQEGWRRDILSILKNSASECTSDNRYCKWQYYNTASVTKSDLISEQNCGNVDTESDVELLERNCVENDILESESEVILTEFDEGEEFTTILDYVLNHQDDLSDAGYNFLVLETYESSKNAGNVECCTPSFFEGCTEPSWLRTTAIFTRIDVDESDVIANYVTCDSGSYPIKKAPLACNIYNINVDGDPVNLNPCDTACEEDGGSCDVPNFGCHPYFCYVGFNGTNYSTNENYVFERVAATTGGGDCNNASALLYNVNIQAPTHINPMFDFEGTLETNIVADGTSCEGGTIAKYIKTSKCANPTTTDEFKDRIHSNAIWFKHSNINIADTPSLVLHISKMTPYSTDNYKKDCLKYANKLRVSIFDGCGNNALIKTICVDPTEGYVGCLNFLTELTTINDDNNTIYIAIDTPYINVTETDGTPLIGNENQESEVDGGTCDAEYLSPTWGCFSVNIQSPKIENITIRGGMTIHLRKICTYSSECPVTIIKEVKCDPIPFQEGKFAYWQSTINYPNNEHLYDSSGLIIPLNFFDGFDADFITEFEETFTDGEEGENYILKEDNTDFRCKPIRHFKFPDNSIAPIIDGDVSIGSINPSFKTNKIFPIGIYLDNDIINKFLDLAVSNELITQEFRDSITGYEIFKGDVRLNRSIIGKGLLYDMYKYQEQNETEDTWFANFPYNDLRDNELLWTDENRTAKIPHPFGSDSNIKFTFHSPEFSFERPNIPFELKVEAYQLGNSKGKFTEVNKHPEMVLLGQSAYRWATALAIIESALELTTDITNYLIQIAQASFAGLTTNWGQAAGWAGFIVYTTDRVIYNSLVGVPQKRYDWLKVFFDNGTPYNFAAYYASEGWYNSIVRADFDTLKGSLLRGIRARKYLNNGRYSFREDFEQVSINHYNRESAVFLSVAADEVNSTRHFELEHNPTYSSYDDSRTTASDEGVCNNPSDTDFDTNTSNTVYKNLYAPYVSLKNYVPAQYGDIDSVKWMSTHYCGRLDEDNSCDVIFGGETFLSRFYLKRKFPFFLNPMLLGDKAIPDLTPFSYSEQRNVGFPTFYVDFNTDQSFNFGSFEMPDIRSYFKLDCYYEPKMYVKPPSKFYLYYYGIPSFIVESRVNLNYRHGENNKEKDFAPNQSDYIDWTQEKNVSIREDNYYFYNPIFSHDNDLYAYRTLPFNYNPEEWNCQADHKDRTIYSLQDGQPKPSNDYTDRWSVFLANNKFDFGNKFGDIIMLKNLSQQKILALFTEGAAIFNSYSTLKGGEGKDYQVGDGGIFATAPTDFFKPGYGGTQHRQYVSSEFGDFWADAKRGRVYSLAPNASDFDEISRYGRKNWFRENLPFTAVKKQFPNITDDMLDNPYNGYGIVMWWDARFSRLFITKKNYTVKDEYTDIVSINDDGDFIVTENGKDEVIHPSDDTYFNNCSWTVAFSPLTKTWVSYYSFTPDYAVSFDNYFATGKNWGENVGVYSHLLVNSFCVFYGERFPWKIQVPFTNTPNTKFYQKLNYKLNAIRYVDTYDFIDTDYNFNEMVVYNNNKESTGRLKLVTAVKNNMQQYLQYPKYESDGVKILATKEQDIWEVGGLFDNTIKGRPLFNRPCSNADLFLNESAYNYTPTYKNLLRSSDGGSVLFTENEHSQIKFTFSWMIDEHTDY